MFSVPPRRRSFRSAFTLVELLVVISIITILIGLLMPALNQARQMANSAECLNNQRQIMTAFHSYSNDFGAPPPITDDANLFGGHRKSWTTLIGDYIDQQWGILLCPTKSYVAVRQLNWDIDPKEGMLLREEKKSSEGDDRVWNSYGANGINIDRWSHTTWNDDERHHGPAVQLGFGYQPDRTPVKYPADTIGLWESRYKWGWRDLHYYGFGGKPGDRLSITILHLGKTNKAYMDGHANSERWYQTTPDLLSTNNGNYEEPRQKDLPRIQYNAR